MFVEGIGNVIGCNAVKIFIHDADGKEYDIQATKEKLQAILDKSITDMAFYARMSKELRIEYERKSAIVDKKYHYITNADVKAAFKESRYKGLCLSIHQPSNNEECLRQNSAVHGLYDGVNYAMNKNEEAYRLKEWAKSGLHQMS